MVALCTKTAADGHERGQSLRASGGTTAAEEEVLGHVVHWLDGPSTRSVSRAAPSSLPLRLGPATSTGRLALWNSEKQAIDEANNILAMWDLEEHARWVEARMQATTGEALVDVTALDGQRRDAQTGKLLRSALFRALTTSHLWDPACTTQKFFAENPLWSKALAYTIDWLDVEGILSMKPTGSRCVGGAEPCQVTRSGNMLHGTL